MRRCPEVTVGEDGQLTAAARLCDGRKSLPEIAGGIGIPFRNILVERVSFAIFLDVSEQLGVGVADMLMYRCKIVNNAKFHCAFLNSIDFCKNRTASSTPDTAAIC